MLALYSAAYNRACSSLAPYESGIDQQSGNMMNRIAFAPVGPTSAPSGSLSNRSLVAVSFATPPLLTQVLVCCIDLLNPQVGAAIGIDRQLLAVLQHAQDGIDAAQVFVERCTSNLLLAESSTLTLTRQRREALADVTLRYNAPMIEDEPYGMLPFNAPATFAELAPDLTYHVTGLSKTLGAGLRVGYLKAPTSR